MAENKEGTKAAVTKKGLSQFSFWYLKIGEETT